MFQPDGPLDISLGVPVEPEDQPATAPSPSTSKPGAKISLWVVPRGEEQEELGAGPVSATRTRPYPTLQGLSVPMRVDHSCVGGIGGTVPRTASALFP